MASDIAMLASDDMIPCPIQKEASACVVVEVEVEDTRVVSKQTPSLLVQLTASRRSRAVIVDA